MPARPKTPNGSTWFPVSGIGLLALAGFTLFLLRWMATDSDGYLTIVDDINLVIHEAGHPIFRVFGEWPGWWGGTWMELLVPAVICGVFIWQRHALSAAFAGIWFFENFHYIAYYMADARTQALPLAGGGEHDWAALLEHYGKLEQDTVIAGRVNAIGYAGIVICLALAVFVWLRQRGEEPAPAPAPQHFEV